MKKSILILLIFINFFLFSAEETHNILIRNSSNTDIKVKLVYKVNQKTVYEDILPKTRTIKIDNLIIGTYLLYYKVKTANEWRVMNVLINSSNKTYVLF